MNYFPRISLPKLFGFFCFLFITSFVFAQESPAVKFTYSSQRLNDKEVIFSIKGKIASGVKLFAIQKSPDDIMYSTIQFDSSLKSRLVDSITQKQAIQTATDPALESEVHFMTDSV
ncbi:MAG: hypothetical protein ABI123_10910, partial [Ginsengibacter sp.]